MRQISGRNCSNIGEVVQKFTANSVFPSTNSGASCIVQLSEGPLASINSSSGLSNDDGKCVCHLDCNNTFATLRKLYRNCPNYFIPFSPIDTNNIMRCKDREFSDYRLKEQRNLQNRKQQKQYFYTRQRHAMLSDSKLSKKDKLVRVLLTNTSKRIDGVAVTASRLMGSLKNSGIKAKPLVCDKQTDRVTVVPLSHNWCVVWKFVWERTIIQKANRFKRGNIFAVNIANTSMDITTLPGFQQADIVHLYWINQGMSSLKNIENILASGKPAVWTVRDIWPCTGICHHAREYICYQQECRNYLFTYGSGGKKNLSYRTFHKKRGLYKERYISFMICSHWLEGLANRNILLTGHTVTCILNPTSTNLFKPHNK